MPEPFPQPPIATSEPPPSRQTATPVSPSRSRSVGIVVVVIILVLVAAAFILNRVRGNSTVNDALDLARIEAAFRETGIKKTLLFSEIIMDREMTAGDAPPPDNADAWRILRQDIERYASGTDDERRTAQGVLQRIETHYAIRLINARSTDWTARCADRLGWAVAQRGDTVLTEKLRAANWRTVVLIGVEPQSDSERYRLELRSDANGINPLRFDILYRKSIPGQRAAALALDPQQEQD
ncbi:MAG: hypothetical protein ABIH86_06130 [Planctomycetota bacterium]